MKKLSELLAQVRDEQSYIVVRERTHRNTAESTNGRVKWWSIFQLGVLLGEGIFQVWWLKRFFEVSKLAVVFSVRVSERHVARSLNLHQFIGLRKRKPLLSFFISIF